MANVTPQSVACCRSPLAQPPLAPDNVESEAGSPLEPLTEFMASLQFRDPKSASDDVKEFGFGYIDDLELTDNSDIKAMFEYVTDRKRPGHHQWTPLQQGRFLRQVTALKEKLKAGWQAIPNCILAKHTHTHTHTHTHNSMQDEQKKEREVSVASYVTLLEMANITPQVKVAVLKVLIEHETDESVKAVVAPALQGGRIEAAGDKRSAAQNKRTRTTRQATQTQPFQLSALLDKIPAEDWCRSWPAGRTIMLRSTSKRIKDAVDKMRLPAVVRLSRPYAGTDFLLGQLAATTARCLITTLELPSCHITGQNRERLAGLLAQCPALAYLDLSHTCYGAAIADRLALGVLAQCTALTHLDLSENEIGPE